MYYIGFLKKAAKYGMIFKSIVEPKKDDLTYFVKVMGPYTLLTQAQIALDNLKYIGINENPASSERQRKFMCAELGRKRSGKSTKTKMTEGQLKDFCIKKNVMSSDKALRLTKKVIDFAKDIHKEYKVNPGAEYHDRKFMMYMKDLEKYKIGSAPYIATLAKAYEHLESAKESAKEYVR